MSRGAPSGTPPFAFQGMVDMNIASRAARALVLAALACSPAAAQSGMKPANPNELRPPADILIPCDKAPKGAVTQLQPDLAEWAAVYCTKFGQIFNANDKFFGAFPDSGVRATFGAGQLDNKNGSSGADSYFSTITYQPLSDAELQRILRVDPISAKILSGKPLKKLELVADSGEALTFLVIDPSADPFWVFPLNDKGLGSPAFFVISLATLNRAR